MFRGISILAGPAGCGKTDRLLVHYCQVLADGSLGAALWLSPTHRAAAEVRRRALAGSLHGCFSPQCLTFDQFAGRVLDASPLEMRPIGPTPARQILRRLVNETLEQGKLRHFAPIAHTSGFLDLVVGFIQELKRLEIWPDELAEACRQRPSDKDRELCHLYRAYQDLLTAHALYDAQGRFWSARAQLRGGQRRPFERLRHVFVDGFTDFTRTEHEVIEILAGRVESLTISLPLEAGERRSELFAKSAKTVAQLRARHPQIAVEHMPPRALRWPAMAHLERSLFANSRSVAPAADTRGIEIMPAAGVTHEIELLARRIKRLIARGDESQIHAVAPSDIVVVFRSLAETADLVRDVFGQFGIPVAIGLHPPLERAPIMSALLAWLRLDLDDWPFRQVLRALSHNYFRPSWPEWEQGRAVAAAERLVHKLRIPAGRADLIAAVEQLAARDAIADTNVPNRRASLWNQAKLALPLLKRLARSLDRLPESATLGQWSAALVQLAEATGMLNASDAAGFAKETCHDGEAWQRLLDALAAQDQLSSWLGETPALFSRREFFDHLRELVRSEPLPLAEDETGCVRVLAAESVRNLSAPYVFAAGLSEKAFPPPYREDCIYSEAETRELVSAGLPLVPHRDRRGYEMLLFYEVVTRATRRLVLSFPALDPAALPLSPSPYVSEVEHAFAPLCLERTEEKDLTGVPTSDDVVSPRDFRVRAVAQALAGDGALLAELCRHPSTAVPADNILAGLQASVVRQGREFGAFEGMFSTSAARTALAARYGSNHCWSPSQLEHYARCPYQFLLASVMRLEPLDEPALEVDYLGRGRMLHEVLLAAHRGLNERAQAHRSPSEELEDQFHAASLELLRERVGRMLGDRALDNGLLEIDARHVAAWLSGYHRQHSAYDRLWREPVRPAHFEVAFGPRRRGDEDEHGELPGDLDDELSTGEPFELQCGEETIRFSGRIDRIDIGQLGGQAVFNIVDYKSGSPSPATSARAVVEGYSLQLPLYALAARWLLAAKQAIPFRAAYWHVAADGYKEKEAIKFQLDSDGRLVASPDWAGLESRLRERVRSLVDGIRGGQFPMHSVDDKCTSRCAYSTVCRVNQVRQLDKAWQAPREESK